MNDESLSALLDGECSPSELDALLRALDRDPALRQRLSRLSAARAALGGARIRTADTGFADRVMAGLDAAPNGNKVVPLATRRNPAWRPALGLAAAAGAGALAVLALRPDPAPAPASPTAALPPAAEPAPEPAHVAMTDAQATQLRNYLMAYSHSRAQQGIGGTLGYARFAAYTAADRTQDPEH